MEFPSLALGTARLWPANAFALCNFGKAQQDRRGPCQKPEGHRRGQADEVERQVLGNFTMPLAVGKA